MFKLELDIPTYAEWKAQVEKVVKEQPVKAQEYQKKIQQFWQDWFEDVLKPNYDINFDDFCKGKD